MINCDESIRINPNCANAHHTKGFISFSLKDYKKAIECFDEAIRINPNLKEAHSDKGKSLLCL